MHESAAAGETAADAGVSEGVRTTEAAEAATEELSAGALLIPGLILVFIAKGLRKKYNKNFSR
ncbi:MAG: hypothetical protein IJZ84_01555 [Lachnospiraceae bacterium]|nr:hypothetical protein [Lachnospiraceae bacterium]